MAKSVGHALAKHGIHAVLTGGACANIYSRGAYQSADIDFVLSGRVRQEELDLAMSSVGFVRHGDRYVHPHSPFFVEFPAGPLAIGSDHRIVPVAWRIGAGHMLTLSASDSCRDRLAAFYHWNDRQSLAVAVEIAARNEVNLAAIRRWSLGEGAESR